jgi:DNA (cytosine-5)-methyltransferase 1
MDFRERPGDCMLSWRHHDGGRSGPASPHHDRLDSAATRMASPQVFRGAKIDRDADPRDPGGSETAGRASGEVAALSTASLLRLPLDELEDELSPPKASPVDLPCIDLFSGAGGLSLGLSQAGFTPAATVELNRDALDTYSAHHPTVTQYDADITKVSLKHLRGQIALVAGGPPCQPFSSGGKRLATSDDRNAVPHFVRVLDEVRPQAFLMENVPGLVVGTRRVYFESVRAQIEALVDLGYAVTWRVLNAADYGVPQNRRRLFMIGLRGGFFRFPKPTQGNGGTTPHVAAGTVVDPQLPLGRPNPSLVTYARRPDLRPSPYDGHVYNGGGRPIDLRKPSHTILASAGGNKTHWLDAEGIVPAYHAHLIAGGAPREGVVPGARRLTVEESAALQTFPRSVTFCGSRSSQYSQIGNAVPVLLAKVLGQAIRSQLDG